MARTRATTRTDPSSSSGTMMKTSTMGSAALVSAMSSLELSKRHARHLDTATSGFTLVNRAEIPALATTHASPPPPPGVALATQVAIGVALPRRDSLPRIAERREARGISAPLLPRASHTLTTKAKVVPHLPAVEPTLRLLPRKRVHLPLVRKATGAHLRTRRSQHRTRSLRMVSTAQYRQLTLKQHPLQPRSPAFAWSDLASVLTVQNRTPCGTMPHSARLAASAMNLCLKFQRPAGPREPDRSQETSLRGGSTSSTSAPRHVLLSHLAAPARLSVQSYITNFLAIF